MPPRGVHGAERADENARDGLPEVGEVGEDIASGFFFLAYWNRTVPDEKAGIIGQPTGRFYGIILGKLADTGVDHDNP